MHPFLEGCIKQIEVAFPEEGNLRAMVKHHFIANLRLTDKFFLHEPKNIATRIFPHLIPFDREKEIFDTKAIKATACNTSAFSTTGGGLRFPPAHRFRILLGRSRFLFDGGSLGRLL